jgi:capsular polysaccharide biosynthesis protein
VAVEPYRESIEDFLRRWRSRYEGNRVFRVLVITVVLAALGVTSSGLQQTPTYEASAQVWVDQKQGDQHGGEIQPLPPPGQLQQTIILEMMHTIETRSVAQDARRRLGLPIGAVELFDNLTVEQVEGTQFIRLTYEDANPERAKQIVNTVGEVSSELISDRSRDLTAKLYEKARVSYTPVSPHPISNGLLTLVIGLALCAGTVVARPDVGARAAGTLNEWAVRQGVGEAEAPALPRTDPREAARIKEQELLEALDRRGKLTAVEAALETSLSVEEAERMLQALAFQGQLEVTVEHGKLLYSLWGEHGGA